jgi:uncharacterized protein YbjT (DUF2867 family)
VPRSSAICKGGGGKVRALTRSPDAAKLPSDVAPVRGDLGDVDAVRAALDGVSTLFLLVPNVAELTNSPVGRPFQIWTLKTSFRVQFMIWLLTGA